MINNLTVCIGATCTWTGIDALLIDTSRGARAVRVDNTLRTAIGWHADIVGQAGAGRDVVGVAALRVGAARTWHARISWPRDRRGCGDLNAGTLAKRIAGVARRTLADGIVIGHLAAGIVTARARTGIHTLLIDTGGELGTIRADHTLGPTVGWGSLIARQAGADTHTIHFAVLAVRPTRIWIAGFAILHNGLGRWDKLTGGQRIPGIAHDARANRIVIADGALRI